MKTLLAWSSGKDTAPGRSTSCGSSSTPSLTKARCSATPCRYRPATSLRVTDLCLRTYSWRQVHQAVLKVANRYSISQ